MAKSNAEKSEKKLVSRREFLVGSGAVIVAIALAACTSKTTTPTTTKVTSTPATKPTTIPTTITSTTPQPTSTPPSTTSPAPGTTSTLTPKYGGTMRYITGSSGLPLGWPAGIFGGGVGFALQSCLETLLRGDVNGNLYPWLAESYKVADDLKSITFALQKGVKFHDGSDFNAEVAKWNLDNLIKAKKEAYWASVDILDDYTIRVNFTEWRSNIVSSSFSDDSLAIMVSKTAFEKNGLEWMRLNAVGTGPFKFISYKQDTGMKFERNPDYWVKGKPYLEGIENIFINDTVTQRMVMEAGNADMMNVESGQQASDLAALGLNVDIAGICNCSLVPDTANADSPWANQKVREAVEYAIDKEAIAKSFGYGYWQAPYQIVPRGSPVAYNPDFTLGRKYDLGKAKQLLTEAGYSNGFDTTIICQSSAMKDISVAMQSYLAKVGIQVKLDYPDMGLFMTYYYPGSWPSNAALYTPNPSIDVYFIGGLQFMFSMTGKSWARPPELMQAWNIAATSSTQDAKLVRAVTDMMTKDALIIPIHETGGGRAQKPYVVCDFNKRGTPSQWNWEDAWLNK